MREMQPKGTILKNLQTTGDTGTICTGRPAKRRVHKVGFRVVHGPTSDRYKMTFINSKSNFQNIQGNDIEDGKYKNCRRGVTFSTIMNSAMQNFGLK